MTCGIPVKFTRAVARNIKFGKMAVVRKVCFSLEDVLNQGIVSDKRDERPPDCLSKVKLALCDLAKEEGLPNVHEFVSECVLQVEALLPSRTPESATTSASCGVPPALTKPLYPRQILKKECGIWLTAIRRRIGGRNSIRHPYYGEISRDMPWQVFQVLFNVVKSLDGFVEPFCVCGENTKASVISFTSMRLVNELFVLLSGHTNVDVAGYFKRSLSGSRKGHTAVIVSDVKDFSFTFKKRSGKLVIGFSYGEWNANGFAQHVS